MSHPNKRADPSPAEIEERAREVRERGFVYEGDFFPAWGLDRYEKRNVDDTASRAPFFFPEIILDDLFSLGVEEEEDHGFSALHELDSGP